MQRQGPAGRRVGVFGGTFDPPHIGHLIAACDVRDGLGLDTVLLVVANEPWQKVGDRPVTAAGARLEMVRSAVEGEPGLEASDVEIRRGGPSYTVETLEELRRTAPEDELFLVLGADAAAGLDTWKRWEELPGLCSVVVVGRPGQHVAAPAGVPVQHLTIPQLDVSSSDLRARAAAGRSLRHLVPDGVISLIREGDLYGERR